VLYKSTVLLPPHTLHYYSLYLAECSTRNLALTNRLHIRSTHKVTTVNFSAKFFNEEEGYGILAVAAAAMSINFRVG